jgi:hypothetical protein
MKKAGVAFPGFLFPLAGSNFVNSHVNSIICIEKSQPFENLNMLERGLYATFLTETASINEYATLYREYGVATVMNAINALLADGHFRAETGSRPVKYARSQPKPKKSKSLSPEFLGDCLRVYKEVRDPNWVNHNTVTRALQKALTGFVNQVGQDNALDILKRGLIAQKNGWAKDRKVDFMNLLTNDKVIRFGEPTNTTDTPEGMVYRLSISKPDPRLPTSTSYAIRVDARNNGTLHGFVFPEGQPNAGVITTIPAKAITTQLQDWSTYQQQHA